MMAAMRTAFVAVVTYGQVVVSAPVGTPPALMWTDDEVAQGFAWDRDLVAFGIPDHDGTCAIAVDTDRRAPVAVAPDALWAVAVPYTAVASSVEVGDLFSPVTVPIAPGRYRLAFQARPGGSDHAYALDFAFVRDGPPGYAILYQGELASGRVLSTQARRSCRLRGPPVSPPRPAVGRSIATLSHGPVFGQRASDDTFRIPKAPTPAPYGRPRGASADPVGEVSHVERNTT